MHRSEVHQKHLEHDVPEAEGVDGSVVIGPSGALIDRFGAGLASKGLVLNKLYMAIRVVSARRAFVMLCKELAEVIHVDEGKYVNYDFASWQEISAFQKEYEATRHDWVKTVRCDIAV